MADQTLVPAFISVTYEGTELNIVDAKFSLQFKNSTNYEENMTPAGRKGYLLRKGISTEQEGDIYVVITKSSDGKSDESIKFLEDTIKKNEPKQKPEEYATTVVLTCKDPGEKQFLSVSFSGYILNLKIYPSKNGNGFTDYVAEFKIYDPLSLKIEN